MELPLDDETLQRLYAWIDEIPLSRPKKNIARDFSDGILLAEVIAYYFPKLVQMHNYSPANSVKQKQYNWNTLNRKVLKRLHVHLSKDDIDDLVSCRAGAVEHLLVKVQLKIANYREKRPSSSSSSSSSPSPSSAQSRPSIHAHQQYEDESLVSSPSAAASSVHSYGAPSTRSSLQGPVADNKQSELREPQTQGRDLPHHESSFECVLGPSHGSNNQGAMSAAAEATIQTLQGELAEKDQMITDLRETIQILELKVQKLEQLVRLKDGKIQTLAVKLRSQKP
ncbi:hypothetical protein PINS_up001616 [Pythium insidiosum]|nr:hypothetical protein PINS_up001616 [Pythium insidiosum]